MASSTNHVARPVRTVTINRGGGARAKSKPLNSEFLAEACRILDEPDAESDVSLSKPSKKVAASSAGRLRSNKNSFNSTGRVYNVPPIPPNRRRVGIFSDQKSHNTATTTLSTRDSNDFLNGEGGGAEDYEAYDEDEPAAVQEAESCEAACEYDQESYYYDPKHYPESSSSVDATAYYDPKHYPESSSSVDATAYYDTKHYPESSSSVDATAYYDTKHCSSTIHQTSSYKSATDLRQASAEMVSSCADTVSKCSTVSLESLNSQAEGRKSRRTRIMSLLAPSRASSRKGTSFMERRRRSSDVSESQFQSHWEDHGSPQQQRYVSPAAPTTAAAIPAYPSLTIGSSSQFSSQYQYQSQQFPPGSKLPGMANVDAMQALRMRAQTDPAARAAWEAHRRNMKAAKVGWNRERHTGSEVNSTEVVEKVAAPGVVAARRQAKQYEYK